MLVTAKSKGESSIVSIEERKEPTSPLAFVINHNMHQYFEAILGSDAPELLPILQANLD